MFCATETAERGRRPGRPETLGQGRPVVIAALCAAAPVALAARAYQAVKDGGPDGPKLYAAEPPPAEAAAKTEGAETPSFSAPR